MPFKMGDLTFTGQASTLTTSSSGSTIADVMVGDKYIYVVHQYLNNVGIYNKNLDGTIGSYIRNVNWYSQDSNIVYICESNSSVPYAYAVYTEDGQDYLVGWSSSHNALFQWTINKTNQGVTGRVQFNVCPRAMTAYSRGGWDGGRYVYFWNRGDMGFYRWDLSNKNVNLVRLSTIASNGLLLDSSYTGSGLYVSNGKAYWGSGSNESDGYMACFDINTGAVAQGVMRAANLASFGVTAISAEAGCIQINPTNRGLAYYFYTGNIIKTLFLSTLITKNVTMTSTVHSNDVSLSFDVANDGFSSTSTAKWRVLANGNQVVGYSEVLSLPITNNQVVIPNSMLNLGANTIRIEMQDNFGAISFKDFTVTVTNNQPTIVTTVSKATIHADNVVFEATVTDELLDPLSYRILLNGNIYSDWSEAGYGSPMNVRRSFRADELQIGVNTIKIEVKDNFKGNATVTSGQSTVTKNNTKPTANVTIKGQTVYMTVDDADGDYVKYRILLNGQQVIPEVGYSIAFPSPTATMYTLPKNKVNATQSNTVRVEVIDTAGDTNFTEVKQVLNYSGLMFKDPNGFFYTTDFGQLLKYLDMGVIYSREKSAVFEVLVENTLGYPVKNIVISAIQGDLDPVSEKIEFSDNNVNFYPQEELLYPSTYDTGESLKFYVRINSNPDAVGGGNFKIKVTGEAL
jgi:hypothetical protein